MSELVGCESFKAYVLGEHDHSMVNLASQVFVKCKAKMEDNTEQQHFLLFDNTTFSSF